MHAYVCFLEHEQLEQDQNPGIKHSTTAELVSAVLKSDASSTLSAVSSSTPVSGTESHSDGDLRHPEPPTRTNEVANLPSDVDSKENRGRSGTKYESLGYTGGLVLITVSGGGNFDAVKTWSDGVVKVKSLHPALVQPLTVLYLD